MARPAPDTRLTMSSPSEEKNAPRERRDAYRCSVGDFRARLKLNERVFPVDVFDESAGGLAVRILGPAPCEVGQSMWLETEGHLTEVRLIHSRPCEDATSRSADSAGSQVYTELGLLRLSELAVLNRDRLFSWRRFKGLLASLTPLGRLVVEAVMLAFVAFLVAVLVNLGLEYAPTPAHSRTGNPDWLTRTGDSAGPNVGGELKPSHQAKKTTPHTVRPNDTKKLAEQAGRNAVANASRLLTPTILLQPNLIRRLNLSESQLFQFRRIDNERKSASVKTGGASGGPVAANADSESADLSRRLLNLLTPQQRKILDQELSN
jgi:hypothetical protein